MSESETGAGRQHAQLNKPHNINLPCQIYCKGAQVHAQIDQDKAQKQLSRHPVSNIDRQWVKKRLDAVSHPSNSQGIGNIGMMMNFVCTRSTAQNRVSAEWRNTACLGFCSNISSETRDPELYVQSLSISLIYDFRDVPWLHFQSHQ